MREISIVPINAIEPAIVHRLGVCLEERFLYPARVRATLRVPKTALNGVRKQLFLGSLIAKVAAMHPGSDALLLGITEFDLYKTSHQFVFGGSDEADRCAIVSTHRLRPEFYGEEPDANVAFQRLLKESVHELGHALGLKHCYNVRCAMYFSNTIFDTDNKDAHLCEACEKRSRAGKN